MPTELCGLTKPTLLTWSDSFPSPASVTEPCARLAERGLIRESAAPHRSNAVGRVPYSTVALMDLRGRVVARREPRHERTGPARVVAGAAEDLAGLLAGVPGRRPLGVGVAVGGWMDRETGAVVERDQRIAGLSVGDSRKLPHLLQAYVTRQGEPTRSRTTRRTPAHGRVTVDSPCVPRPSG
ncbi:hypothetical protein SCANM63S_05341 [Streptomyces canarius]